MVCEKNKPFNRLPKNVKPFNYKIEIQPDLVNFTFNSKQDVFVEVLESTDTIIFNSHEIFISAVDYRDDGGKVIPSQSITIDDENEICTVIFPEKLPIGKTGFFHMEYQGTINDKLKGLYRSKNINIDGTVKYAAVTHFEPTFARKCFPCWDEPLFKATFDISLTVSNDLVALSNMPVKSTMAVSSNMQTLVFETTPVMSTYLVAIAIGDFDFVEDQTTDGTRVRVYTPKGKKEQGTFALNVATKVMPYYKSYFDISYDLPKIDLIAVADFMIGAMENWGLVTYRETFLLVDPENSSAIIKQNVALVVGHELSHQWFGNLVTMKWWTDLWLKEGYASFVEFLCVDYLFKDYDIWTQFVTDTFISALELDALKSSHPIEVPVNNPSEINEIFDSISYNKGASIIRMLHSYIGDDDFRKGMHLYLKKFSYSNAETNDLWQALEEASKKPVAHVMSSWTKRQGFPLLRVLEKPSSNEKNRVLSITQERFFADGSVDKENSLWVVPIAISCSDDPKTIIKNEILETKSEYVEFEAVAKGSWIKINSGTVSVFRTLYSSELLEQFIPAIKDQSLPPLDRLGLLDDLSALSQAGHVSTSQTLKLMESFKQETDYTVWTCIVNALSKIGLLISHLEINLKYKAFGRALFANIYARLGWDKKQEEGHLDTLLRAIVVYRMVSYENEATIQEAKRRFEDHVSKKNILPADLRKAVYCAALMTGNAQTFDTLLRLYRETDLLEEKSRILGSLGATKDEALLKRALQFSISEEVRLQETIVIMSSIQMSHNGRVLVWQFFQDNYQKLIDRYKSGLLLVRLIKNITADFVTEDYAKEIEIFFEKHPTPSAEKSVKQSIETIKLNAAWLKRDQQAIEDFLKNIKY